MTVYIDPEQGVAVVERLGFAIRDEGLFLSALARPSAGFFNRDAYQSIELKAAALLSSLCRNHSLFDGNKRTAWVLTLAFLNLNGFDLEMTQDEKFDLVQSTARGDLEPEAIAQVIAKGLVDLSGKLGI